MICADLAKQVIYGVVSSIAIMTDTKTEAQLLAQDLSNNTKSRAVFNDQN